MKILFVLSGNKDNSSNLVVNQAESLVQYNGDIHIEYYLVKGKGLTGYLKNIRSLGQKIKEYNPDIIHAHYSFCGFLSSLAFSGKPVITSLMGSDLHLKMHWRIILFMASVFWKAIIVKSQPMKKKYLLAKTFVIPNGVNFSKYDSVNKQTARQLLGLKNDKTYILFLADPKRNEKNFQLAQNAYDIIKSPHTELLVVHDIPHDKTKLYYYATDILILSSIYEGSPNVIKEAMVCNCPIVSTNVGDVNILFEGVEGNYISGFDEVDFSEKMKTALDFARKNNRTLGRQKIVELGIDANSIAYKITSLYEQLTGVKISRLSNGVVCLKGLWDDTIPGIQFNKNGFSNYSQLQEKMMNDYPRGEKGKAEWKLLVDEMKKAGVSNKYDCIVGVSGGVDSSYLLHLCKEQGLRPLAVHLDNGFNSEISVSNIQKITTKLDIDLVTWVINYEEIKSLFRTYMFASLPWIDAPTDLAIKATMYDTAIKHKIKYIIRGNDFRSEGKQPKEWTYSDARQLKFIHKKFGKSVKLKTYPIQSFFKMIVAGVFRKIKDVRPFYYLDYNKEAAKKMLMDIYDWKDYGGHHHENLFTKFAMAYWLPKKFKIDKRKINLSAQILSGAISRQEALDQIQKPFDTDANLEELKEYVKKKLDMTETDFDVVMKAANKNYTNYPSNYNLIYNNIKYFKWIVSKLYKYKPMSIDSNEMIK